MNYTSITNHTGDMRCETVFSPSKAGFITDVGSASGGKGQYPCPADMLAAAVASCMLSMMAYTGKHHDFDTRGISVAASCEEEGNKLTALNFLITVPTPMSDGAKQHLETAVAHCPVGNALAPCIRKNIEWKWAACSSCCGGL